jgi:uracil-DNA glycosylase family 4
MSDEKLTRFLVLCRAAEACRVCPDLADKKAVLSDLNGNLNPKVFFIAEAPGRQGADRTRRPFYGDKSGENFQKFLDSIGLRRDEIFITNAVMCSPRKESGANRSPKTSEIRNCSTFLKAQISLIRPAVVATLGSVALEALKAIEHHQISLKVDIGKVFDWNGLKLVPLYHPSPQVIASTRRFAEQLQDFQLLKKTIEAVSA